MTRSVSQYLAAPWASWAQASPIGYVVGLLLPVSTILIGFQLGMPAFVFEHLTVLFVVAVAIQWGMRPALVAAAAASLGDNLLLREPIGRPAITGLRDILDFVLFVGVAVIVGWLVGSARQARIQAQEAAGRERRAREERDRLMAAISHDLATPLSAIRGTVEFVRRFGRPSDADVAALMKRVDAAAARATSLVRTLAEMQTLDAGHIAFNLEVTDLRRPIVAVVQMLEHVSERHRLLLTVADEPVFVTCDAERLRGVFENVITNAIKYSPDGGLVEVALRAEGQEALVRVRDYGIGISPAALACVFDRGYRAPEAEATASGLGLGLSIASEIVRRHGGHIDVRPAAPRGTVVVLRLPRTAGCGTENRTGLAALSAGPATLTDEGLGASKPA